jgi:serine O-acetyltransferase
MYSTLWKLWMATNGSSLEWRTLFAGQPCFPHGIKGIFISGDAVIGRNCVIFHQVTIGSSYLPGSNRMGAPVIEDNCFIGAGAKIIGGIRIGRNCRIGAGCVVFDDVPDNTLVLTSPPRMVQREVLMRNRHYSRRKGKWFFFEDGQWILEDGERILKELETARLKSC